MRLIYIKGKHPNFGDDLNAELWPALLPGFFDDDRSEGFLGIGTVIGHPYFDTDFLHVFSGGVGYDKASGWEMPRTVWCVRGPLSAELMGERASAALTDGAILAPAAFGIAASVDRSCVGVIPHWESELAGGWDLACAMAGFELISPSGTPRDVIGAIARKALIVTESLHGAIIADTLGIPWVAFATTGNFSLLKWADWSLSVGVNGRIHPVPSPSGGAVLKFGRFKGAGAGKAVVLERELALADYNAHMNWLFAPAGTSAPRFQFKARLKSLLNLAPVARVAGFSPESTAAALTRIARAEPQISDPALRRRLADEMTHRLATLRTRVGR